MNEVFKALSDPTRREILALLRQREMTAGEIAERFPQSKSTLSGHFAVLKAADLVRTERRKQHIVYALNLTVLEEVMAAMMGLFNVTAGSAEAEPGRDMP